MRNSGSEVQLHLAMLAGLIVFNIVITFVFNSVTHVFNINIIVIVMMIVSARMTTVLCGREASAGKLRSAGRLEPKRLCSSGSKPRLGLK